MTEIMTKQFEDTEVEIIKINGKLMFEIYSTGMALGYVNYGKNKNNPLPHKSRIKKVLNNAEIVGCVHGVNTYITEEQLYDFMLESKTEKVKPFRKWVTHEVLPSIRQNGGYIANQENLTPEQILANAILVANNVIENQKRQLEEQKPKVEYFNIVADSKDNIDIGSFAKILKDKNIDLGRNRLFDWFRKHQIFMRNNTPYQTYIDRDYFKVIQTAKGEKIYLKTLITPKGTIYFTEKIAKEFKGENKNDRN